MADSTTTAPVTTPTTAPATDTTATLPNGTTIGPDQVNIGTVDVPNVIDTSSASRNAANQASGALNSALSMYGLGNGTDTSNTTNTTGTNTATDTTNPTANGTTVNADGSTTSGTSTDPYIQSLNNIASSSNASTQLLVQSILGAKNTQQNQVNQQYAAYKQGLQLLGIEHNAAESTPDLLMSQVNQAEDQHQQKLQTIQSNTAKALATAQTAQENNDFKTLTEQMAYVKELNAQKVAELKAYQTSLTTAPKIDTSIATQIYPTLKTLDPADQEAFLQAVSQKYNIPLGPLVSALATVDATQTKAAAAATTAASKAQQAGILTVTEAKTLGLPYGTTVAAAQKMGIVPTTKSTKGSGAGTLTKEQIAAGEAKFAAAKGSDGFVDPALYQSAYQSWTKNGGTTAAFIKAYPPKDYVNPAATTLPSYLMPPKTKASSSARTS